MSTHLLSFLRESLRSPFPQRKTQKPRRSGDRRLAYEALESRQLLAIMPLANLSVSENTGEKPQSKVWEHAGQWWTVMPNSSGTWVFRLDGTNWTPTYQITSDDSVHADVKSVGDLAHVLLFGGSSAQLATLQYDGGPDNRFEPWVLRPQLVNVPLAGSVETATLDVDSTGRMWVAYDVSSTVEVRYSDGLYTSWSAPFIVASGINSDDISAIVAMPNNRIGVLWSNQSADRFGFRMHVDGAAPTSWLAPEVPAAQSALSVGGGMADDHLNVAVASDGTLYAAVKTSYDKSGYPKIALLVRRPNGAWDNLYQVDTSGTRPIVVLSETANRLIVAYTTNEGGGDIVYRVIAAGQYRLRRPPGSHQRKRQRRHHPHPVLALRRQPVRLHHIQSIPGLGGVADRERRSQGRQPLLEAVGQEVREHGEIAGSGPLEDSLGSVEYSAGLGSTGPGQPLRHRGGPHRGLPAVEAVATQDRLQPLGDLLAIAVARRRRPQHARYHTQCVERSCMTSRKEVDQEQGWPTVARPPAGQGRPQLGGQGGEGSHDRVVGGKRHQVGGARRLHLHSEAGVLPGAPGEVASRTPPRGWRSGQPPAGASSIRSSISQRSATSVGSSTVARNRASTEPNGSSGSTSPLTSRASTSRPRSPPLHGVRSTSTSPACCS